MEQMNLASYLGILDASEEQLMHAFSTLADKHNDESELRETMQKMAGWCRAHRDALAPFLKKYGEHKSTDPERVRAALFQGVRAGGLGRLRDLHDLSLLITNTNQAWFAVHQAAKALRDTDLLNAVTTYSSETDEQLKWVTAEINIGAAQALTVNPEKSDLVKMALPKTASPAGVPAYVWSPTVSGLLILVVGLVSWAAGQAWLFPALGPTAYIQAHSPALPAARWWNTIVGHAMGLLAGFAAVLLLQVAKDPVVMDAHVLTLGRTLAASLAIALTMLLTVPLKAEHPPAAATTLLVALGTINTGKEAMAAMIGAVILALIGEGARQMRLKGSFTPQTVQGANKVWSEPGRTGAYLK